MPGVEPGARRNFFKIYFFFRNKTLKASDVTATPHGNFFLYFSFFLLFLFYLLIFFIFFIFFDLEF